MEVKIFFSTIYFFQKLLSRKKTPKWFKSTAIHWNLLILKKYLNQALRPHKSIFLKIKMVLKSGVYQYLRMSWGGRREIFHSSINYWKPFWAKYFSEWHRQQIWTRYKVSGSLSVDVATLWIRHKANFLHFLFCCLMWQFELYLSWEQSGISSDQTQRSTSELQPANRLPVRNKYFGGMIHFMPK